MAAPLPLEGVRVLEFTVAGAGPMAGMIMSDMGAEVIRVDDIHRPDTNTRGPVRMPEKVSGATGAFYPDAVPGPRPYERYTMHNYLCRNRRNVTFSLADPEMYQLMLDLVKQSDVVISNNSAGTLDKMGMGYAALSAVNPRIIVVEMPGFGSTGPYSRYRMYGSNADALSGHVALRGYPDADPTMTYNIVHCDSVAATTAAFATIGALIHREKTGEGQHVDLSQFEAMVSQMPQAIMAYGLNGEVLESMGNRDYQAVQGVYRCQGDDDWVAIAIENDAHWANFCNYIGRTELIADPRFASQAARREHHDDFDAIASDWSTGQSKYDAFRALQDAGVPASPVNMPGDVATDPHLEARGFFERVTYPQTGEIVDGSAQPGEHRYPGPLFDLSETPMRIRSRAATLGEHNEYVFKDMLNLSDEAYRSLIERGLIGDSYPVQ